MAVVAYDRVAGADLAGRFGDLRLLRTGTLFSIYEGREAGSNRLVAIKLPDPSRPSWVHDALRTQAQLLGRVGGHPNVLTLYQSLLLDDGRPALVLDRCAGSLFDTAPFDPSSFDGQAGGRMPVAQAVSTGIKLAGALATVHAHDVLHCDVRPANILVTEFGDPVLAGFDEAVSTLPRAPRYPRHVTTAHTAPELLEGAEPSPATDVYGLGVTLYELIAGRTAFREYAGESAATMIVRLLNAQVRPIVAPDVPIELSDLVGWAMAADPADRPPSPAWMAEELGRIERRQGWTRTRMITG